MLTYNDTAEALKPLHVSLPATLLVTIMTNWHPVRNVVSTNKLISLDNKNMIMYLLGKSQ